jgi:hypothetical protein
MKLIKLLLILFPSIGIITGSGYLSHHLGMLPGVFLLIASLPTMAVGGLFGWIIAEAIDDIWDF